MSKKILLSGVKPTGRAHIGNYFGAMKQFVHLAHSGAYHCFVMIADYHALNFIQNKEEMQKVIYELALDYLAIGLDPEKVVIFKQSDVSAHTELAWIFDTLVTMPYLMRAHAYKDAEAKNKELSVGTFNYPVLMAADILLYGTQTVPVGQDQKQHVEYTRDIAQKFNNTFGETFTLPEELIITDPHIAAVPGTDGRKMSKSYNNTIPLFASREEIEKVVMSIVTDSGSDIPANVHAIHRIVSDELHRSAEEFNTMYDANKGKYQALKKLLIDDLDAFITPLRDRRAELAKDPQRVVEVLKRGAEKANERAQAKLMQAKKAIGVL
jgi:tryptophanyl-tRNA synthetase